MQSELNISVPKQIDHGQSHPVFWPSACVHCHGDLQLCEDQFGPYRKCITCSRTAPEGLGPDAVADIPPTYTSRIPGLHKDLALAAH